MTSEGHDCRVSFSSLAGLMLVFASVFCVSPGALAHGVPEASRDALTGGGILEYTWTGAEHMLTGYDHLLFLFGVLFFLQGFRDVVKFITAFTLGHCITLLGATLAGITADAYLVDAVIALSVIYKGFENLKGFERFLRIRAPNLLAMVFVFGLIHGFGLSTRLQELPLGEEGLVSRILAFNLGVELGQVAALTLMLGLFNIWRKSKTFERFANISNGALVLAGVGLFFYQVSGYLNEADHVGVHDSSVEEHGHHINAPESEQGVGHEHGDEHEHGGAHSNVEEEVIEPANEVDNEPVNDEAVHSHDHGHGHHSH